MDALEGVYVEDPENTVVLADDHDAGAGEGVYGAELAGYDLDTGLRQDHLGLLLEEEPSLRDLLLQLCVQLHVCVDRYVGIWFVTHLQALAHLELSELKVTLHSLGLLVGPLPQ
jgi:hypothetical protein